MSNEERGMKGFVLGLIFVFLGLPVWGQGDVFSYPLDTPQGMDAFELVCAEIGKHSFVRGNFELERKLLRLGRTLRSSGDFIIARESGMVWQTLRPAASTMVLGRDYMVQYRPGGQKTVVNAQGNETFIEMAEVLSAVFSGDSAKLTENFNIFFIGSAAYWEMGLLPQDSAIASFAVKIALKGGTAVSSIIIYEKNGDSVSYALSCHNNPAELTQNEKSYFAHP
jgi:hypothetical protein